MTVENSDADTTGRTVPSWWKWTPRRTKSAALCGLLGGFSVLLSTELRVGFGGGTDPGIGGVLYLLSHVLFAVAVLAANARYDTSYGRGGDSVAVLLVLSLVGYAGSITVVMVATVGDLLPVGVLAGTAYMAIRLFGTLYGLTLWSQTNTSRLTAGSFVALFPAIFLLGPLTQFGLPATAIEAPLALAGMALGYDLWRTATATEHGKGDSA